MKASKCDKCGRTDFVDNMTLGRRPKAVAWSDRWLVSLMEIASFGVYKAPRCSYPSKYVVDKYYTCPLCKEKTCLT